MATANRQDDNSLQQRIIENMQEKETEELLQTWKKNNRKEWSDLAFEVIHDILFERLGTVPDQTPPLANDAPEMNETREENVEDNNADGEIFHDPNMILRIALWARLASWLVLVLGAALIILRILADLDNIQNFFSAFPFPGQALYALLYGIIANVVTFGVNFIILQTISQGLYLFLDIEGNTYLARKRES